MQRRHCTVSSGALHLSPTDTPSAFAQPDPSSPKFVVTLAGGCAGRPDPMPVLGVGVAVWQSCRRRGMIPARGPFFILEAVHTTVSLLQRKGEARLHRPQPRTLSLPSPTPSPTPSTHLHPLPAQATSQHPCQLAMRLARCLPLPGAARGPTLRAWAPPRPTPAFAS